MTKANKIRITTNALNILSDFELNLDTANPETNKHAVKIIGYGEMSTVFIFKEKPLAGIAFKRMALFETEAEATYYEKLYLEYHEILSKIGIVTPDYGCHKVTSRQGKPVLYLSQKLLAPESICHKLIHTINIKEANTLLLKVLETMAKVVKYNAKNPGNEIGLDGQLSNWSFSLNKKDSLRYLDTSTPLMKKNGAEQLDANLFLRICPSMLVWVIKLFFLKDVVTRYYNFRLIIIDLIANLFKEKKQELIAPFLIIANTYLQKNYPQIKSITEKEIIAYYKEDALIWRIFLLFRKIERFFRTKILRRPYNLILPGKINR
ncbi:MAG: hypothetical protein LDLANPLL_01494 [Turneriella sp.]|nr:hypothetical protein [Turneriella sp.]